METLWLIVTINLISWLTVAMGRLSFSGCVPTESRGRLSSTPSVPFLR